MLWMMVVMAMASEAADLIGLDLQWVCVNDTVMGGVSESTVEVDAGGVRFSGELSLENNGGFTSVRTRPADLSLTDAAGFRVRLTGDGRSYDFTASRSDVPIRGGSYRVRIDTVAGEELTVELPLSDFQATAFGRPLTGAPPLTAAPERISSVGFLLADKRSGAFSLVVHAIEAYSDPAADASAPAPAPAVTGRDAVLSAFARAIERGAPLYNSGDPGGCAAVYQTVIESVLILSPGAISDGERAALLQAVSRAQRQDGRQSAWTLREAMDAVLTR
ncbi:MAG: NADH dehydrogenase [ubiquinone] 1 alpha subcomplex assembly factor 1 [Myxococcota bacterium]|jgi:NADH dehydrogenase [ubiquinone] 1 alpha subcomplex assembly factor 1